MDGKFWVSLSSIDASKLMSVRMGMLNRCGRMHSATSPPLTSGSGRSTRRSTFLPTSVTGPDVSDCQLPKPESSSLCRNRGSLGPHCGPSVFSSTRKSKGVSATHDEVRLNFSPFNHRAMGLDLQELCRKVNTGGVHLPDGGAWC